MTPPIIHRPERQGRGRRTLFTVLTATAWLVYFYLWLPLITLVAWYFGVRTAYGRLYLQENAVDPFLLLALPIIALVCAVALLLWAEYNRARFGGEDRRKAVASIGDAEVAQMLGADAATAASMRDSRIVLLTLDPQARPTAAGAPLPVPDAVGARLPVPPPT